MNIITSLLDTEDNAFPKCSICSGFFLCNAMAHSFSWHIS